MEFIFLPIQDSSSATTLIALIDQRPESIVGCIIIGGGSIFKDYFDCDNPAQELFERAMRNYTAGVIDIFLIVKGSEMLEFKVLALCEACCVSTRGGPLEMAGMSILDYLGRHNIPVYASPNGYPQGEKPNIQNIMKYYDYKKEAFYQGFNDVSHEWILNACGLNRRGYIRGYQ